MIISYLNQKGGVGKTTLAVHTATALALDGLDVILVDADPQGSALDWLAARQAPPLFAVVGMPRAMLHRQVPRIAAGVDAVVIDGPPSLADIARSAMLASDLVAIPVQPSPYDVWAAGGLLDLVDEARVVREDLAVRFVVSRRIANTVIGRDVTEALSAWPVPVLASQITQRVAFAESAASGLSVLESAPASAAAAEVVSLVGEIAGLTLQAGRAAA